MTDHEAERRAFWTRLPGDWLSANDVVARMHAVELMERESPYQSSTIGPYFQRVQRSLQAIPIRHWKGALLIFSSVVYFTHPMLDHAWRYLWSEFKRRYGVENFEEIQFFEVDPCGMFSRFAHVNGIHGRLDTDLFPRLLNFSDWPEYVIQSMSTDESLRRQSIKDILTMIRKKYWVFLVDKSLSGHSLSSELIRVSSVRQMFGSLGFSVPKTVVLAQIFSDDSRVYIGENNDAEIDIMYAICCDETMKVNSTAGSRLMSEDGRRLAQEVCYWFRDQVLSKDAYVYDRMNTASGDPDSLAFGYRGAGLTITDPDNCPTDSVPLLWYSNGDGQKATSSDYVGPYPRTHSRLKEQSTNPTREKWKWLAKEETAERIKMTIGEYGNDLGANGT